MELYRTNLLALLITLALMASAVSVCASTIPITGSAGWAEANSYGVKISGPSLALSIGTCDAPEFQGWTGPFTFRAGSIHSCTEGSASYGSDMWTASYMSAAPDEIDAGVTGIPGPCGSMIVNPDGTWSETCAVSISGVFDGFPLPGHSGPLLSGTIAGSGAVDFVGHDASDGLSLVDAYGASFNGTAVVTSPGTTAVPEPASLLLVIMGAAAFLAFARKGGTSQAAEKCVGHVMLRG